ARHTEEPFAEATLNEPTFNEAGRTRMTDTTDSPDATARTPRNLFNPKADKPVDPVIFCVALGLIVAFVILGAIFPDETGDIATDALDWVMANFGWLFILMVA